MSLAHKEHTGLKESSTRSVAHLQFGVSSPVDSEAVLAEEQGCMGPPGESDLMVEVPGCS